MTEIRNVLLLKLSCAELKSLGRVNSEKAGIIRVTEEKVSSEGGATPGGGKGFSCSNHVMISRWSNFDFDHYKCPPSLFCLSESASVKWESINFERFLGASTLMLVGKGISDSLM